MNRSLYVIFSQDSCLVNGATASCPFRLQVVPSQPFCSNNLTCNSINAPPTAYRLLLRERLDYEVEKVHIIVLKLTVSGRFTRNVPLIINYFSANFFLDTLCRTRTVRSKACKIPSSMKSPLRVLGRSGHPAALYRCPGVTHGQRTGTGGTYTCTKWFFHGHKSSDYCIFSTLRNGELFAFSTHRTLPWAPC